MATDYLKNLGPLRSEVQNTIQLIADENIHHRFFEHDVTLWSDNNSDQAEIRNRMDWIYAPGNAAEAIANAKRLLAELLEESYTHAVVIGMGGSSLAAEVFSQVFQNEPALHGLQVSILDSTDPVQIDEKISEIPLDNTVFIIGSKSGTTAEVRTLFSFLWDLFHKQSIKKPGDHFIAISDPDSQLQELALEKNFRYAFQANPKVGGRYSALIAFGLVPAVFTGMDVEKMIAIAQEMEGKCGAMQPIQENPGFMLGAIFGAAYQLGKDKINIIGDKKYQSVGSWIEQLVAESSGKSGKGILPIDQEPILPDAIVLEDRVFYYLRDDGEFDQTIRTLSRQGIPVIIDQMESVYHLGALFYQWEIAVALACALIGVNAFNQPNVQESKSITNEILQSYTHEASLEFPDIVAEDENYLIYGDSASLALNLPRNTAVKNYIEKFIEAGKAGEYLSLNAFLPRNANYENLLQRIRKTILTRLGIATTLGFGPRFLHSTGQLHKGGKNNGIFVMITQDSPKDFSIPGRGMPFSILEKAQALGDFRALVNNHRRVIMIHVKNQTLLDSTTEELFS